MVLLFVFPVQTADFQIKTPISALSYSAPMNHNLNIKIYENNILLSATDTNCLIEDNFLSYNTDSDNIRINLKDFSFTKENVESILRITKEKCALTLKEIKQSMDIPLDYINYTFENNKNVYLEYKLISQDFPLKIILEIGDEKDEI